MTFKIIIAIALIVLIIRALIDRSSDLSTHLGKPNSVGLLQLISTLLATAIGGGLILGLIQFGATSGIIGVLLAIVYCLSFIGLGYFAKYIRKIGKNMQERGLIGPDQNVSFPLLLAKKYNEFTWGVIIFSYGIIYIGFLAAQFVAMSLLIMTLNIDLPSQWLIIISSITIFLYVSIGGFRSVLKTDIIQITAVIVILTIGVYLIIYKTPIDFALLEEDYWNPFLNKELTSHFVWLSFFVFPTLLLRLDHWQRIFTAKSDKVARNAYVISGFILIVVFCMLLLIGLSNKIEGSANLFYVYEIHLLTNGTLLNEVLFGLAIVAFIFAIFSSADTVLNASSSAIVQSLQAWGISSSKDSKLIIIISLIITVLSTSLAILGPDVVSLITEGFKIMVILLPSVFAAIMMRKPDNHASSLGIISGFFVYLILKLLTPIGPWAYILGFFTALIVQVLIVKLTKISKPKSLSGSA